MRVFVQREAEFKGEFLHGVVVGEDFGAHQGVPLGFGVGDKVGHQLVADALPLQAVVDDDAKFAACWDGVGDVVGVGEWGGLGAVAVQD